MTTPLPCKASSVHAVAPPCSTQSPYNLFKRLGMFVLAVGLYVLGNLLAAVQAGALSGNAQFSNQQLLNGIAYAGVGLLLLYYLQNRRQGFTRAFAGHTLQRPLRNGLLATTAVYVLCGVVMALFDIPDESFMLTFFDGLDRSQIVLLCISLVIFPPLAEELLFRHFLMRLLPWERSTIWKWLSIVLSTVLFAAIHTQYEQAITMVALVAVGFVLAVARIASGGLLVPVLIHACAEVLALLGYVLNVYMG